jgi:hypothetical protein
MPRWSAALVLIVFGIVGVYQGVTDPCIQFNYEDQNAHSINGRDAFSIAATASHA